MTSRNLSDFTWHDKPIEELNRDELIALVGILHDLIWRSADNFERVVAINRALVETQVGNA